MPVVAMMRAVVRPAMLSMLVAAWTGFGLAAAMAHGDNPSVTLSGQVESNGTALPGYQVVLYAAFAGNGVGPEREHLGRKLRQ
jgi:hypothetical protein